VATRFVIPRDRISVRRDTGDEWLMHKSAH